MDDGTIDLSIMHKIVREMTGTLLVGSLLKQAINLQGNNNDSSQGNKGHPLLPIVINLTYSSIGWKKNASSPTTQEWCQPTWYAIISLYRGKNTISVFHISYFPIMPVEVGRNCERSNGEEKFTRTGWEIFWKRFPVTTTFESKLDIYCKVERSLTYLGKSY